MNDQQHDTRIVTKPQHSGRNLTGSSIDHLSKAHERGKRGHRLIRVPGRGYVVVRRASGRIGIGPLLIAGGIGAVASDFSLANLGRVAIVVGVILFCFQKHREEQRAQHDRLMATYTETSEAYRFHKELGYEEGYRARMEEERPTLVDLCARREEAAKEPAITTVPVVVDRG